MSSLWKYAVAAVVLLGACSSDETSTDDGLEINGPADVELTTGDGATQVSSGTPDTDPTGTGAEATDTSATESSTPAATASTAATTSSDASTTTTPAAPPSTFAPYDSEIYADPAHWICRADTTDVCDDPYPITDVAADGTSSVQPYTVATDAPIDCFYVYPTVSGDPTFNSDLVPDSEIPTTQFQAARFNQDCTMYAPVYRSVTSGGLSGGIAGDFAAGWRMAYEDVLDAWRYYLANLNEGRPVVILAHSQGSFHVVTLLREEIDPDPKQRALLVSAIIPGTSFQVAPGSDVGGDTQNIPLCRADDQTGCVITFQTYRDAVPPTAGALFGRPGNGTESACTNPAALAGGPATLDGAYPPGPWLFADPAAAPAITTPRAGVPGLVIGECKELDGYRYLAVTVDADPTDPRADDIPGDGAPNWGLHTIDMNIAQETLIELVRTQTTAFLAGR